MPARRWAAFAPPRLVRDELLRNSFYLYLNTGVQAAIGFAFWLLNSRLYTASQVGTATALISGASVIAIVSLCGFNSTFVRFLPTSRRRDEEINTGLLMVVATALIVATLYVLVVPLIVPSLEPILRSLGFAAGFILLTAFMGVNIATDSVFIAFRKAQYNVVADGIIQGAVKLGLPVLVVGLGAYGIFMTWGLAALAAVVASFFFMIKIVGYRPKLRLSPSVLRLTWSYSAANYTSFLLTQSLALIIPLIVLSTRGARQAAFYFIAYQVANLLFAAGSAIALSFFAEASYEGSDLPSLVRRSAKIAAVICVSSGVVVAATGHWLLLIFGPAYSANATGALAVLALSSPLVAMCSIAMTVLRITRQLRALLLTSAVYAVVTASLTLLWAEHGLQWVAVAYLLGTTTAGLLAARLAAVHLHARSEPGDTHPVPR